MEPQSAAEKARVRRDDAGKGKSFDGRHLAIAPYTAEQEKQVMALPTWIGLKTPLQNPDGTFPFMLGYDTLGETPL